MGKGIIKTIKKALFIWTGICLVIIGLVLMPMPVLPGIIFVLIGISLITHAFQNKKAYSLKEQYDKILLLFKKVNKYLEKKYNFRFNFK